MTTILVPKEPAADRAFLWVATDETPPPGGDLVHSGGRIPLPGTWRDWPQAGAPRLRHQLVQIGGLPAHTSDRVQLESGGRVLAEARLTTLPQRLPGGMDRPLTFLLGSCFSHLRDHGEVDAAYRRVPSATHAPDFKILCGDQIYLDSPWSEFLRHTHSRAEMQDSFLDRYWSTWAGRPGRPALSHLLSDGANVFTADDHELWNNAPNRATLIRDSWRESGRLRWRDVATSLYDIFQTPASATHFSVPPLSFNLSDTRFERDADEKRLMPEADLARLEAWIRGLPGPGVLVLGQPIFSAPHDWTGHLADWGLADYREHYPRLVRALAEAPHDVLVLTGDVHYRRLAWCRIAPNRQLSEVISSPLALIDDAAGGAWKPPPDAFPATPVPGAPPREVRVDPELRGFDDHFLVLQCREVSPGVRVDIYDFAVRGAPTPGASRATASLRLV